MEGAGATKGREREATGWLSGAEAVSSIEAIRDA